MKLTGLCTIDDEHISVGEEEHVPHAPSHGHGLHQPLGCGVRHPHPPARLLTRQERFPALGDGERVGRRTSTNEHLDRLERVHKAQRQHDRGAAGRVVAGPPGEHRERPDDCVGLVVVDDGLGVGKDVEVSVWQQVHIRVPVVGLPIATRRLCVQ